MAETLITHNGVSQEFPSDFSPFVTRLSDDLKTKEILVGELKTNLDSKEKTINEVKVNLDSTEKEKAQLKAELEAKNAELEKLKTNIDSQTAVMDQIVKEKNQAEADKKRIEKEKINLRDKARKRIAELKLDAKKKMVDPDDDDDDDEEDDECMTDSKKSDEMMMNSKKDSSKKDEDPECQEEENDDEMMMNSKKDSSKKEDDLEPYYEKKDDKMSPWVVGETSYDNAEDYQKALLAAKKGNKDSKKTQNKSMEKNKKDDSQIEKLLGRIDALEMQLAKKSNVDSEAVKSRVKLQSKALEYLPQSNFNNDSLSLLTDREIKEEVIKSIHNLNSNYFEGKSEERIDELYQFAILQNKPTRYDSTTSLEKQLNNVVSNADAGDQIYESQRKAVAAIEGNWNWINSK